MIRLYARFNLTHLITLLVAYSCSGSLLVKGDSFPESSYLIQPGQTNLPTVHPEITKRDIDRNQTDSNGKSFLFSEDEKENKKNQQEFNESQPERQSSTNKQKEQVNQPVRFSGRKLLREIKYIGELQRKDVFLQLKGNALVKKQTAYFSGPLLQILGKNTEVIVSPGTMKIRERKDNVTLNAGFGRYTKVDERAIAGGKPVIRYYKEGHEKFLQIKSFEMERLFKDFISTSWGNVRFKDNDYKGTADKAVYLEKEELLYLYGNPIIYNRDNVFLADEIIVDRKKDIVTLLGKVELDLSVTGQDKSGSRAYFTGDKAVFEQESVETREQKIYIKSMAANKAQMFQESFSAESREFLILGDDQELVVARYEVVAESIEDRTQIFCELLRFNQLNGEYLSESAPTLAGDILRPNLLFFDEKRKPESLVISDELIRITEDDLTQARGDVETVIFEEDEKELKMGARLKSSFADYNDELRTVTLLGDPSVERGQGVFYSDKILIYPDKRSFELLGQVRGSLP